MILYSSALATGLSSRNLGHIFLTIPVNDCGLRPRPVLHDGVDDHVRDSRLLGDHLALEQHSVVELLLPRCHFGGVFHLGGHPYMTSALRGEGGRVSPK